jgi:hypothetical protein
MDDVVWGLIVALESVAFGSMLCLFYGCTL